MSAIVTLEMATTCLLRDAHRVRATQAQAPSLSGTVKTPTPETMTRSATGARAQPCVGFKTSIPVPQHIPILSSQAAKARPTGLPTLAVKSTLQKDERENKETLGTTKIAVKKGAVKPKVAWQKFFNLEAAKPKVKMPEPAKATTKKPKVTQPAAVKPKVPWSTFGKPETSKPRVVKPKSPTPTVPALKSAMKSAGTEKTEKKVSFAAINRVATVNEHAVWSRPESSMPMKSEGAAFVDLVRIDA